jgi:hypothetical protein
LLFSSDLLTLVEDDELRRRCLWEVEADDLCDLTEDFYCLLAEEVPVLPREDVVVGPDIYSESYILEAETLESYLGTPARQTSW